MKEYSVKYYLDDFLHAYAIEANNEYEATMKVLNRISTSQCLFHDLEIKRIKRKEGMEMERTYFVREQCKTTGKYCSSTLFSGTHEECEKYVQNKISKDATRYHFIELVIQ